MTKNSRWVLIDVMVRNQAGEKVATGEAMVEFPPDWFASDCDSRKRLRTEPADAGFDPAAVASGRGRMEPKTGPFALTFGAAMA